ncbi:MAG: hypothetical protein WC393_04335 [Candidatus Nanoarchaeia archaeon]|jgi:hypothetical protein
MPDDETNTTTPEQVPREITEAENNFNNIINALINALKNDNVNNVEHECGQFNKEIDVLNKIQQNHPVFIKAKENLNLKLKEFFDSTDFNKIKDKDSIIDKLKNSLGTNLTIDTEEIKNKLKNEIEAENEFKNIRDEINEITGTASNDTLRSRIQNINEKIKELINKKIVGDTEEIKLKNFMEDNLVKEIIGLAQLIEGNDENSPNSFKRLVKLEKKLAEIKEKITNEKLKKNIQKKIDEKSAFQEDFGFSAEIRLARMAFMNSDNYKNEDSLVYYLFDKLEDVLKTPQKTKTVLVQSEQELKNLTIQTLNKKRAERQKEIQELGREFRNLTRYFQNNFETLKNNDLNEALVKQYLEDAFNGLEKIEDLNEVKGAFETSIKEFDSVCQKLYEKLWESKDEKDAPLYRKLTIFIFNIMHVYDILFEKYTINIKKNNKNIRVSGPYNIIQIIGDPESDSNEGLNGNWSNKHIIIENLYKESAKELEKLNEGLKGIKNNLTLINEVYTRVLNINNRINSPKGIKDFIHKLQEFNEKNEDKQTFMQYLDEIKKDFPFFEEVNAKIKISKIKSEIKNLSINDELIRTKINEQNEQIEKADSNKKKLDDKLTELNDLLKNFEEKIKSLISLFNQDLKNANIRSKIINYYNNDLLISFFKIVSDLKLLNENEIKKSFDTELGTYKDLMFKYGNVKKMDEEIKEINVLITKKDDVIKILEKLKVTDLQLKGSKSAYQTAAINKTLADETKLKRAEIENLLQRLKR